MKEKRRRRTAKEAGENERAGRERAKREREREERESSRGTGRYARTAEYIGIPEKFSGGALNFTAVTLQEAMLAAGREPPGEKSPPSPD